MDERADGRIEVLNLPGMEGALNPLDEAQLRAAEARQIFEATHATEAWMDDYFALIGEGWSWRQALYMIWSSQPKPRVPETQEALATRYLGLTSDRAIRDWRQSNPAMELRIRQLTISALGKARAEVVQALIESAATSSYRNSQDRKLYFEMTGDYVQQLEVGRSLPEDLASASAADLAAMAQIPVDDHDDESGD